MKYLHGLLLFCLFFIVHTVNAQVVSTYSVLSTAYNRSTAVFHPLGAIDGGWFLIRTQVMAFPLNPATIINYPNSPTYVVPNAGNSSFPGIISNRSINRANNTASTGLILLTYRTYFTLPALSATPNRYSLQFKLSADDAVDNVQLNGTVKGQFLSPSFNNLPQFPKPYILTVPVCDPDFVSGQNYIDITVADAGGSVCFYGEVTLMETTNLASNPTVSVTALPAQVCAGQAVTLTASGASTYTWSTGATGSVTVVNPTVTSTYTVFSSAAACTGLSSSSAIVTVSVTSANPTISATALPAQVCAGQAVALTASGAFTYTWSTGATGSVTVVNPTVTSTYTVLSAPACTGISTSSAVVTVSVIAVPGLTVTASPTVLCAGESATLTASGANTYTWSGPGLSTGITNSVIVVTPLQTTIYTLSGQTGSCLSSTTLSVNVLFGIVQVSDIAVCNGYPGTLTASGASSYSWSNAATLSSSTGSSVIASPSSTQSYTVTGITGACTSSAVATVSVLTAPLITAGTSTNTICYGSNAVLTAGGAASYTWSPSVTMTSPDGSMVTASPTTHTTYTVTGGTGTCTNTAFASITVLPPLALAVQDRTICIGNTATLSVSGAITYTWQPGAVNSFSIAVNPVSTEVYTVSGTSASGCMSTIPVIVHVVAPPLLSVISNTSALCSGSSATLSASGASSYTWSPTASTTSTIIVSPLTASTYTVIGSGGTVPDCISSGTVFVNVLPVITPTLSTKEEICLGQSTKIYAAGGNVYQWNPPAGIKNPKDPVITVSPSVTTVYSVSVSNNSLCPVTATLEIIVHPLPVVNAGKDTTINMDDVISLNGTGNAPVGFISGTGLPLNCTYCSSLMINPQENTCYTLMGENEYSCIAFDEVCVTVTKDWSIYIPNAFTPNGDGVNDVYLAYGYGILSIDLMIFDRWGELIFKEEDTRSGWDGKRKGILCEQGIYTYKMNVHVMTGVQSERVGHVTLLSRIK
jgi:gliding motility-associated-like protein